MRPNPTLPTLLLLATGSTAINVTVWSHEQCRGLNSMRSLYVIPQDGCKVKGEFDMVVALEGKVEHTERALTANSYDAASESEFVVFFSSEDCHPDSMIPGGLLGDEVTPCSSSLEGWKDKISGYKSWAVWDIPSDP